MHCPTKDTQGYQAYLQTPWEMSHETSNNSPWDIPQEVPWGHTYTMKLLNHICIWSLS